LDKVKFEMITPHDRDVCGDSDRITTRIGNIIVRIMTFLSRHQYLGKRRKALK